MFGKKLSDISPHLTKKVVSKAFKLKTGTTDEVKSMKITKMIPVGVGGLFSTLYTIQVKGNHHKATFIAKANIKNKHLRKAYGCEILFRREAMFYTKVMPALQVLQFTKAAREELQRCIPVCYASYWDGVHDFILLDDLRENGHLAICEVSPTQNHLAIDTLAHFHAVSISAKTKSPRLFQKLVSEIDEVCFTEDNKSWYTPFLNKCIEITKEALLEHEAPDDEYFAKFLEITEGDVYEHLSTMASAKGNLDCILHGDCWFSNFMFTEISAAMVDFQVLRYGSPAMDLLSFIFVNNDLCESTYKFGDAVRTYYETLQYYIKDKRVDDVAITYEDLWEEIKKYAKSAFLQSLIKVTMSCNNAQLRNIKINASKYKRVKRIPLEDLWKVKPIQSVEHQQMLVRALRVAVDLEIL